LVLLFLGYMNEYSQIFHLELIMYALISKISNYEAKLLEFLSYLFETTSLFLLIFSDLKPKLT